MLVRAGKECNTVFLPADRWRGNLSIRLREEMHDEVTSPEKVVATVVLHGPHRSKERHPQQSVIKTNSCVQIASDEREMVGALPRELLVCSMVHQSISPFGLPLSLFATWVAHDRSGFLDCLLLQEHTFVLKGQGARMQPAFQTHGISGGFPRPPGSRPNGITPCRPGFGANPVGQSPA